MKKHIKDAFLIGLSAYALISMAYIVVLLSTAEDSVSPLIGLWGKQFAFLLVYSLVLGGSFMAFRFKLSAVAARLVHIAITYLATITVMLALVSSEANPAQQLIYTVITTVTYAAIYGTASLIVFLIKKRNE